MAKRDPTLIRILLLLKEWFLLFDQYCDPHRPPPSLESWLFPQLKRQSYYFQKTGILNEKLEFIKPPASVLSAILKKWDGYWTFVVFDVPIKHNNTRDIIRRRLSDWGFRCLQRSVWFSPLPLNAWLRQLDEQIDDFAHLTIIRGKIYRDNPRELIMTYWQPELWQEEAEDWLSQVEEKGLSSHWQQVFWDLLWSHPKVPLDLLPQPWPLKKMIKTFVKFKFLAPTKK